MFAPRPLEKRHCWVNCGLPAEQCACYQERFEAFGMTFIPCEYVPGETIRVHDPKTGHLIVSIES